MRLATAPTLQLVGATWFAAAAGICFPLSLAAFPGPGSLQPNQLLSGVWLGLALYGIPAAIAGALLARLIVAASRPLAFVFGAITVLLTAILAGPWFALRAGKFSSLSMFASEAAVAAFGQVVIELFLLRGIPLVLGGLAAVGLRAAVIRYAAAHDR